MKGIKKTNWRITHFGAEDAIRSFCTLERLGSNFISSLIREPLDKVKGAYEN